MESIAESMGKPMETTAILVDGGFYRRRAYHLLGDKCPEERANELVAYCRRHLKVRGESTSLLIAGDSDFVPAAKYARREDVDFILEPMGQSIRPSLNEHIDGLHSCVAWNPDPATERLHANHIPQPSDDGDE